MPSAKPNNPIAQKLEGLDEVPGGFRFRPDTTWNRLESALAPAPGRRKKQALLYAAALLFLLAGGGLLYHGGQREPARVVTTRPALQKEKRVLPVPAAPLPPAVSSGVPAAVSAPRQKASAPRPVPLERLTPDPLTETAVAAVEETTPLPDTAVTATAPANAAKRFRIAHINEVSEPRRPAPAVPGRPSLVVTFRHPSRSVPEISGAVEEPVPEPAQRPRISFRNSSKP
ncbi:MAG TPA: hypothetical protein VHK69_13920 [Chitinophagaceae bacterium]|jgi:hypothetical protein|nr:hypothetical protein [Chitinophagaceae bacterium]